MKIEPSFKTEAVDRVARFHLCIVFPYETSGREIRLDCKLLEPDFSIFNDATVTAGGASYDRKEIGHDGRYIFEHLITQGFFVSLSPWEKLQILFQGEGYDLHLLVNYRKRDGVLFQKGTIFGYNLFPKFFLETNGRHAIVCLMFS